MSTDTSGDHTGSSGDAADAVGSDDDSAPRDVSAADSSLSDAAADGGPDAGDGADTTDAVDASSAIACQPGADGGGDGGPSCPGAMTCCNGWCTDTSKDLRNCGACGNVCSSTQFCTGTTCDDAVLKNICANPKATWITDPYPPDNSAGNALGMALMTGCSSAVTVMTANEDGGIAQELPSGRPITGAGNTLVAAGGSYGQTSVGYMDGLGLTPLLEGTDGTNAWIRNRKTMVNVLFVANASLTSNHDYFLLELSVEPTSGTLCFFAYGMLGPGTTAAGYFFQNNVVANRANFTDAWYVYEWTGANDAGIPGSTDTFTLIAHGM